VGWEGVLLWGGCLNGLVPHLLRNKREQTVHTKLKMRSSLTWEELLNSSTDPFTHSKHTANASAEKSVSHSVRATGNSRQLSEPSHHHHADGSVPDIVAQLPPKSVYVAKASIAENEQPQTAEVVKQRRLQIIKDRAFLLPELVQSMSLMIIMFAYSCIALRPFAPSDFQAFFSVVIRTITQFAVPLYFYNSGRLHALSDDSLVDTFIKSALYRLIPGVVGALIMVAPAAFISIKGSSLLGVPYSCSSTPGSDYTATNFMDFLNSYFTSYDRFHCYGFSWLWLFIFEFFLIAGNAPFSMWIRMSYFKLHTSANDEQMVEEYSLRARFGLLFQAVPYLILLGLLSAWQLRFSFSWLYTLFTYFFFYSFVTCTIRRGLRAWLLYALNIPSMLPCLFLAISTQSLHESIIPTSFTYFNLIYLQGVLDQTYHEDHKINLRKNPWTFLPSISTIVFGMLIIGSPTVPSDTQSVFVS
jgi:hypothetical protein